MLGVERALRRLEDGNGNEVNFDNKVVEFGQTSPIGYVIPDNHSNNQF